MTTNHQIIIDLNPLDPVNPITIQPQSGTVLNGGRLRVRPGNRVEFTSQKADQFSLLFPDGQVMNNRQSRPPAVAPPPVTGGDVFDSENPGTGVQTVDLKVTAAGANGSGGPARPRAYEYYITAVLDGVVYTEDPDVYVEDC